MVEKSRGGRKQASEYKLADTKIDGTLAAWPEVPFVLLTTAAPVRGGAGERAWRSLGEAAPPGEIGAVFDVVELGSAEDEARLREYAAHGLGAGAPQPHRARHDAITTSRRGAPRAR